MNRIESQTGSRADRTARYVAAARLSLLWERIWPALWPASGIVGAFVAAALLGLVGMLAESLKALLLLGVLIAAGYFLYRNFRNFRLPRWEECARRVEQDSTLAHRPITEGNDRLAAGSGDAWAEELWRAHMRRLLGAIHRLRLRLPSPGLPARDPYALRYIVLLLVVAGFVVAGPDWNRRLAAAFAPQSSSGASAALLDAWITPPAYTGIAPIYLSHDASADSAVAVPKGSELVLRVHEAGSAPSVSVDPVPDSGNPKFTGTSDEYGASYRIAADAQVRVMADGRLAGRWRIKSIPDEPPVIAFSEPPSRTERNALKIAFTAGDDYGVTAARALIHPVRAKDKNHSTIAVDLPLPSAAKTVTQTVYSDLTENPLAGLEVDITLEATDGAGQHGYSKPARVKLPARVFTNALSRALIEQRQNLALDNDGATAKAEHALEALTVAPEHFYQNQSGVYLAIRTAYWQLRTSRRPDDIQSVENLLWQIASGIEQGGLLSAAEELRRLQQMISQALAQGAPQDVISALMQRYRDALQRYLQALAANPQANGPLPPDTKSITTQDFLKLLDTIEKLAQTGARGQAQQLLAMLQSIIENMRMANGGQGQSSPQDKAMSDAIQGLSDLMGHQRELLDKTFRQKQGAGDPKDGGPKGLAQQQGKLKDDLGKVLKGLGDQKVPTPNSLGEANREMGNSQSQLGSNMLDGASEAEKNVLEALREGEGALAKSLLDHKSQGQNQKGGSGDKEDPLGRTPGSINPSLGSGVRIPDQSEMARARAILEELRRRAAQRGRPKQELDYIDRLLKEF